jgi:hypothetical protein
VVSEAAEGAVVAVVEAEEAVAAATERDGGRRWQG